MNLDIVFTVKLTIKDAIDREAFVDEYGDDALKFVRYLTNEEGLIGCVEDDYEILSAEIKEQP